MNCRVSFEQNAFEDFNTWVKIDKKIFRDDKGIESFIQKVFQVFRSRLDIAQAFLAVTLKCHDLR